MNSLYIHATARLAPMSMMRLWLTLYEDLHAALPPYINSQTCMHSAPLLLTCSQAAAVEVGTSLVNTVAGPSGKDTKTAADQGKGKGPAVPEPLKMVGGIGMELLRVGDTDRRRAGKPSGPAPWKWRKLPATVSAVVRVAATVLVLLAATIVPGTEAHFWMWFLEGEGHLHYLVTWRRGASTSHTTTTLRVSACGQYNPAAAQLQSMLQTYP